MADPVPGDSFMGHPKGLVICFLTEMWERFSFYGMRALLIFYLTRHFLFSDEQSFSIYAAYGALVYITPVIGGIVADRYLGARRAVVLGALLLVAGHFGMAFEGSQATESFAANERLVERNSFYLQLFYFSLALIIMGVGFLKANISTLVGALYEHNDLRRDSGFTLFYMGINAGAVLGALVCGYLMEYKGFSWGFGAAGIGMLLGLVIFLRGQHLLPESNGPLEHTQLSERLLPGLSRQTLVYLLSFLGVLLCWQLVQYEAVVGTLLGTSILVMSGVIVAYSLWKCDAVERDRMLLATFLMSYQILFWALFEQAGSSLNLMTERNVERSVMGYVIPAPVFQSVNGLFIILLAPLFSAGWFWLARRGQEPSTPAKFALSLIFLGMGFLALVFGARLSPDPARFAMTWLIILYLLHTMGELCISPVGLSMVTKLSVPRVAGMMMGCWFLASAAGSYLSGTIAAMTGSDTVGGEVVDSSAALASYLNVYSSAGWLSILTGLAALLLVPLLKRFMHGVR